MESKLRECVMGENLIRVVCIKPGRVPVIEYIENSWLEISKRVNVDSCGELVQKSVKH